MTVSLNNVERGLAPAVQADDQWSPMHRVVEAPTPTPDALPHQIFDLWEGIGGPKKMKSVRKCERMKSLRDEITCGDEIRLAAG
jgi:hypothetical protein